MSSRALSDWPQEVGSQFRESLIRGIVLLQNGYPILKKLGTHFLNQASGTWAEIQKSGTRYVTTVRVPKAMLESCTRFVLQSGTRLFKNRVPDLKTFYKPFFCVLDVIFISSKTGTRLERQTGTRFWALLTTPLLLVFDIPGILICFVLSIN